MFMFQSNKQKKKDKLWFACKKLFQQYNQDNDVMPSVQPQRRLPQRPLRPQLQNRQMLQQQTSIMDHQDLLPPQYAPMKCCGKCACSMSSILENSQQQLLHPSATILQCVCSNRCCEGIVDDVSHPMEMESGSEEMSIEQDYENRTDGFYYESCGDNSTDCNEGDDYDHQYSSLTAEQTEELITQGLTSWHQTHMPCFHQMSTTTNNNSNSAKSNATAAGNVLNYCCTNGESVSNESSVGKSPHLLNQNQNYSLNNNNSIPTPVHSTVTSTITATAASVFRNCCRGSQSNESSIGSYPYPLNNNRNYTVNNNNAMGINHHNNTNNNNNHTNNNNNNNNSKNNFNFYEQNPITMNDSSVKEQFEALMKKLKVAQMDTLCQVVENRCGTDANNSGGWRRQNQHRSTHQSSDCVLVPRETIGDEEPNVIACRLWSWPDLKTSTELKRIPMCPNGMEKVYVCCNPAHWNRILIEEAIPPPYQESVMDRLKPEDRAPSENSKDGCVSTFSGTTTGLRVQIPESFTTNGEDHSSPSPTWCQIDYWELAQRVGKRYEAKNSTVNVYSEGSGGMDLKVLAEKEGVTVPSVHKTRQKIGLGITLSQEADGVWLYNRSKAPIFIHSPTLNDDCRHVCKVPPGYCLNAFDKNRARTQKLVGSPQTGPIDTFSMKISFAKGWGSKYHRSDITACHCWLDVLFSRR